MSAGILLIDGYNLLHAAGMGQRDYRPGDLLHCRFRLLELLRNKLSAAEIRATTVVFDARDPPPDRPAQVVISGIRVLFANPGGDADELIRNWLAHHPTPRRVTLVSGDRELQRAARSTGAKFVGSREFVEKIDRRKGPGAAGRTRSSESDDNTLREKHASVEQTAYWLKVFGDAPTVEPDDDEQPQAALPQADIPKLKPGSAGSSPSRRPKKPPVSHDSKPAGSLTGDELAYWMDVFGESGRGTSAASPEELRLSDLENWLKEFEASERKAANRRK